MEVYYLEKVNLNQRLDTRIHRDGAGRGVHKTETRGNTDIMTPRFFFYCIITKEETSRALFADTKQRKDLQIVIFQNFPMKYIWHISL